MRNAILKSCHIGHFLKLQMLAQHAFKCVQVSYGLVVAVSLICSTVAVLSVFCYSLCYCFVMVLSYVDPIIVMSHGISYPKPTKRERKTFVFH